MATRTMERRRDRILTMMVVPLMTCSARLPVYTLVIAALIPGSPLTQAGKNFLELGNDDHHQHTHDHHGDHQHGDGIKHGRNDLAFDLLGLFLKFRQAVQNDFEHTAEFAA